MTAALTTTGVATAEPAPEIWVDQFGTAGSESTLRIAHAADGSIYVVGHTTGDLDGTNAGGWDAFLRKYDQVGAPLWTVQFGTAGQDFGDAVAAAPDGTVYVVGRTGGDLDEISAGGTDGYLRRFDSDGTLLWADQFGTSDYDAGSGVAVAADGSVVVTGLTDGSLAGPAVGDFDGYVRTYDEAGTPGWSDQFGTTADDRPNAVAITGGGVVHVVGSTEGDLDGTSSGSSDAFLRTYDSTGTIAWSEQWGTPDYEDWSDVAVHTDGSVHVSGSIATSSQFFTATTSLTRKYDSTGASQWTRYFGASAFPFTPVSTSATAIGVDADGSVYVSGFTDGEFGRPRPSLTLDNDAIVIALDASGAELWRDQFGVWGEYDAASSISVTSTGDVFLAGTTTGDLGGVNAGAQDGLVVRHAVLPNPIISPGAVGALEGDTGSIVAELPVTLSNPSLVPITVNWASLDRTGVGLAAVGDDFDANAGTVTFAPGETSKTVPITVFGDEVDEPPAWLGEWGFVAFSGPSAYATVDPYFYGLGVFIIADDDPAN